MARTLYSALLVCSVFAAAAHAGDVYKYVEKDGTVVYSNVVPKGRKATKLRGGFHKAPSAKDTPVSAPVTRAQYDELIEQAAKRYRIPSSLVRAVMHAESNYDANAVSHAGASGLMQLMPRTAEEMYVKDIFDARENIEGGTRYLRVLANQYDGDMVKMIAAYNAGPHAVNRYGGKVPPYEETQAYVRKVLALYFKYKEQSQVAQTESR
jgi:soluble lytic murein transglycosylase-like protein